MKKWIIVVTVLAISLLTYACGSRETPTSTPDIQATVDARVATIATETAIAQTQATIAVEKTAIVATQTAMAVSPTSTLAPLSPTPTSAPPTRTPTIVATQTAMAVSPTSTLAPPSPTPTSAPPTVTSPLTDTPVSTSTPTRTPTPKPKSTLTPTPCTAGVSLPFYVYDAWGSDKNHYVPKGWMGDWADIELDENFKLDLDPSRPSVIRITYTPRGTTQWAGIYWWDPPEAEWGNIDGGFNLSCATKLTFWARGEHGGEKAEFKVGGLKGTYQDSLQPAFSTGPIVLTGDWTLYTLDLTGRELTHIIGGFIWVTNKPSNPNGATIYLDDIRFE